MFWRTVLVIILVGAFTYLGGGKLVAQAGNGLIQLGQGMEQVEELAKEKTLQLVDYISELGQKRVEKTLKKNKDEEEIKQ